MRENKFLENSQEKILVIQKIVIPQGGRMDVAVNFKPTQFCNHIIFRRIGEMKLNSQKILEEYVLVIQNNFYIIPEGG